MGDGKNLPSGEVLKIDSDLYFGPIHENNIEQLRRLNESILPVQYQSNFYSQVLELSHFGISMLAYYKDIVVGAACCRIEEKADQEPMLYVMTLCVLPAYRGRGIGTKLIEYMISKGKEMGAAGVYLHVWTTNQDAIDFYSKLQFSIRETLNGYYKRISPPDAHVLEKRF